MITKVDIAKQNMYEKRLIKLNKYPKTLNQNEYAKDNKLLISKTHLQTKTETIHRLSCKLDSISIKNKSQTELIIESNKFSKILKINLFLSLMIIAIVVFAVYEMINKNNI